MQKILKLGFRYIEKSRYIGYVLLCGVTGLIGIVSPLILAEVVNTLTTGGTFQSLVCLMTIYLILCLVQQLLVMRQSHMEVYLETNSQYKANRGFIHKLYHTSYNNLSAEDPAMLNQKLENDLSGVVSFSISFYKDIISNILYVLFIVVILWKQSSLLCAMIVGLMGCYVAIYRLSRKSLYEAGFQVKERQTNFYAKLYSMIYFMKSIRNNGFEDQTLKEQDCVFEKYHSALQRQVAVNNRVGFGVNLISVLAETLLFLIGGKLVLGGSMQVGVLVVIMNYFSMLLQSTDYFLGIGQKYQETKSSYDRLLPYDEMVQIKEGWRRLEKIEKIELVAATFEYPGQKPIFQACSLFERGHVYWIKGKNGTGKTTMMNLMLGLFGNDYDGYIEINGMRDREIFYSEFVKKNVAIVEQEPYLLEDTLEENMLCKTSRKEEKRKELKELLRYFEMEQFLKKQPQGLQTVYHSLNSTLSGGEKQKIVLIRMLLSDAAVWMMDEPASALDEASTEKLYEELERRKKDHMIIMISHERPSCSNRIVNMSEFFYDPNHIKLQLPELLYTI